MTKKDRSSVTGNRTPRTFRFARLIALLSASLMGGALAPWLCQSCAAQMLPGGQQNPGMPQTPVMQMPGMQQDQNNDPMADTQAGAEAQFQKGTELTRQGKYREAIPHLRAARGKVREVYAAGFNLALCYVGLDQFKDAIKTLLSLRSEGYDTAEIDDLLTQAYIGNSQKDEALATLKKAAARGPQNEKLYLYVADACMGQRDYSLGLTVTEVGLKSLPDSARLHFERGTFLILLDRFDLAKADLDRASELAPGTDVAYMAEGQRYVQEGDVTDAIRVTREAVAKGKTNYIILQILGEALLRAGAVPGQPQFAEAQEVLEKSVAERPDYSASQVTLAKVYLLEGRGDDAIAHLEIARQFDPRNTSIYSHLAAAYRRKGDMRQSQAMLAVLAQLNQDAVDRIRTEPGDTKGGYVSGGAQNDAARTPHQ